MTTTFALRRRSLVAALLILATTFVFTSAYRAKDWPCRANFQCESEYCNATRQCQDKFEIGAACPTHDACLSMRCSGGVCQEQKQPGDACEWNEDCLEGYCNITLAVCEAWKEREVECASDGECRSGRCTANPRRCTFVIYEPNICGKDSDCYGGRCKKDRGLNQCYARKWNNDFCNDNSDCLSLRCETTNCTEPVWLGEPCDEPSDCYSLFCNTESGCVATAGEANVDDIEPEDPQQGITGSASAETAAGGGTVDIGATGQGGTDFTDENGGGGGGSSAFSAQALCTAALAASFLLLGFYV